MVRFIAYIATSIDGFIARKDDDISWLDPWTSPEEDYGYADFIGSVGTAVMGARTYEQSLLHPERLLAGVKTYVITRRYPGNDGDGAEFWRGSPAALAAKIRKTSKKDVYLAGGGQLISRFIDAGLVDELRLFVIPVLLGSGIPLFVSLRQESVLDLARAVPYANGVVELRYVPKVPAGRP